MSSMTRAPRHGGPLSGSSSLALWAPGRDRYERSVENTARLPDLSGASDRQGVANHRHGRELRASRYTLRPLPEVCARPKIPSPRPGRHQSQDEAARRLERRHPDLRCTRRTGRSFSPGRPARTSVVRRPTEGVPMSPGKRIQTTASGVGGRQPRGVCRQTAVAPVGAGLIESGRAAQTPSRPPEFGQGAPYPVCSADALPEPTERQEVE